VKLSLSKEQQRTALLQSQVDDLLSRHSEEVTHKEDVIKKLNIELDSKAELVVLLTQQIYRLRAKLKQELEKSTICSCPHCYVHSKVSSESRNSVSTPAQASSTGKKGVPLKKYGGAHHHHSESPPASDELLPRYPLRNLVPTPPPSTPPSSASGRRRTIFKMASNPEIGTLSSSKIEGRSDLLFDHDVKLPKESNAHKITRRKPKTPQNLEISRVKIRNIHCDNSHQLMSLKELEDAKDSPNDATNRDLQSILPPLVAPPAPDFHDHLSHSNPGHVLDLDKTPEASLLQQQHNKASYLAKFPGLSSAPPSSLHVLHCNNRQKSGIVGREEEPLNLKQQHEGMLLVKETDQKPSDSRASWAKSTPLDSVQ